MDCRESCCQNSEYGSYRERLSSYRDPIGGRTLCCAHRSYWRMYPENSMISIQAAIDHGCDMVEVDVHVTKDNVCVLSHDNNLGRCTNASAKLAKMDLDEIEYSKIKNLYLRFGTGGKSSMISDERICLLKDALLLCENKVLVNLDKVMENLHLRDCVYQTMLELHRQGHPVFEYCIFKLGISSLDEVLQWIREKEETDGVHICYSPWGPANAEYLQLHGYHPYTFEDSIRSDSRISKVREQYRIGYFANSFDAFGEDDRMHWEKMIELGANVIQSDDARLCPLFLREKWGERFSVEQGMLKHYEGVMGDLILPGEVLTVCAEAFGKAEGLTSVTLPSTVRTVEAGAFSNCKQLKYAVIFGSKTQLNPHAFPKHTVLLAPKNSEAEEYAKAEQLTFCAFTDDCRTYEFELHCGQISLKSYLGHEKNIVIPDSLLGLPVYEIGRECFAEKPIETVRFSKSKPLIEHLSFHGCKNLKTVTFEQDTKSIAITAFDGCSRSMKIISPKDSYPWRYARAKGIQCAASSDDSVTEYIFNGSGTEEQPFLISTADDLIALSDILKKDLQNFYANAFYRQTADIRFGKETNSSFSPIGQDGGVFCGVYDGMNHSVEGLQLQSDEEGVSLFGYVTKAEIRNLVTVGTDVKASALIGGVIGIAEYSRIVNCHARNFHLTAENKDHCNVGGVIGTAYCSAVEHCSATDGEVKGYRDLGGFMGEAFGSTVRDCFADGIKDIDAQGNSCGGFVGNLKSGSVIENCAATANVRGALRIGSFSGFSDFDKRSALKNCVALGIAESIRRPQHGGLTGARVTTVENCYYSDTESSSNCLQGTALQSVSRSPDQILADGNFRFGFRNRRLNFLS